MVDKLAIHIAPEANPDNVIQMLLALRGCDQVFATANDLLEFTAGLGIGSRTEMTSTAASMGLLSKGSQGISLSSHGRSFVDVNERCRGDLLHFLMYSGWSPDDPTAFLPSWAYRTYCDIHWNLQSIPLSSQHIDQQVEDMINLAEKTFSGLGTFAGVSFSRKSLSGAHKWLEALQPPVIEDGVFSRRSFCPPELLVLATGWVMRDDPDAVGRDILLSRDVREEICRVCLLDPTAFDQSLDWMIPLYPRLIVSTDEAGYYGRYIRLLKRPSMEDLIR